MSRYFASIEPKDLRQKIHAILDKGIDEFYKVFRSDLKVKFDFENFDIEFPNTKCQRDPTDPLMGLHTLSNGLTFCGMSAGGDWEHPVFFIVYYDGKKLRAYIPTNGNPWNTDTKEAYGNNSKSDLENAKKRWPQNSRTQGDTLESLIEFDNSLIVQDIESRILPRQKTQQNETISHQKSLQEKVEELTFYGTGDEAYELFQQACSFCYSLYGLGSTDEAETVYEWAKNMADDSYNFAQEQAESGNQEFLKDVAKGRFGY